MAYIRCSSGGGGAVEVITGTMTGASGSTSAGEITVTSQQGKTPKRFAFWNNSTFTTSYSSGIFWSDGDTNNARVWYGANGSAVKGINTQPSLQVAAYSLGVDSVTVKLPTGGNYYTGTWGYTVEFE